MRPLTLFILLVVFSNGVFAQGPEVTSWLQNTTVTGNYYVAGNSNLIGNNILVNCQEVSYSNDYVYIECTGVPAYPTGPFQDGNPSQASDQNGLFRFTRNPVAAASGTNSSTTGGNIGLFVNGVALFDYRDGVAWDPTTNALCGGPGNPPCPGGMGSANDWNRDAIPAEMAGFDCSKGHPAMGNYHHHQNPSAFKLDLNVLSTVCNLYDADALYSIDSTQHSPLIGYAYDGFPIYGAYGYKNSDGSGGIARIKSSYELRNIAVRNTDPSGNAVSDGAPINTTYPLGYFREDYEFISHPGEDDFLDEHNGRFCNTPEYPNGTYAYFATVDANWNSAYPYVVGPTFYGDYSNASINSINEPVTVYVDNTSIGEVDIDQLDISVFPNPSSEFIAVQIKGLLKGDLSLTLYNAQGQIVRTSEIIAGSTINYLDTRTLYSGVYVIEIRSGAASVTRRVELQR